MVKKSSSNTRLYIILGILAFAIIVGTIAASSNIEMFATKKEIVYLFSDTCQHCASFEPVWQKMSKNKGYRAVFNFKKLNINTKGSGGGADLANKYGIASVPTIMKLPIPMGTTKANVKKRYVYGGERTEQKIINWAKST